MEQLRFKRIRRHAEGFKFILVGSLAAATHFIALIFFVQFIEVKPAAANILAFFVAFLVSFIGHYQLTFRQTTHSFLQALWRWFCSSLLGFVLNQALFLFGLNHFGQKAYVLIWLVITVFITMITFLLGKFWAFARKEKS